MSITRNLLVTALLASAGHAVAASSVDVSIRGSITPSACELSLANGGNFDLGKVAAKDLQAEQPTDLESQSTQLTVACEAATLMGIESKDNRAGSSYFDQDTTFGLGLANGNQKLGYLWAGLKSYMADGTPAYGIHSMDGGLTWAPGSLKPGSLSSVYKAAPMVPTPVQVLTATMYIDPAIAPTKGLTLTDEVLIDGSITLTVRYL
ncbi:DUF1120 domain-containing protein [Pseudomonas sp. DWP1b1]|uniref:DUF1120 domain-containing protein n=1 Tax=unclassified Pseudomonas TaxID=196821 RepID=UPI003CF5952E